MWKQRAYIKFIMYAECMKCKEDDIHGDKTATTFVASSVISIVGEGDEIFNL